tara:strand:+ start:344 stop:673 length:330 start_codon:yes stop_codon:yes gene_type:complete
MALRIEYETNFGITCEQAHCIIRDARVDKKVEITEDENGDEISTTTFDVYYNGKIFASVSAYEDEASAVGGFNGRFELDTAASKNQYNLIKQAYLHLKTMDGFTDGTDC